MPVPLIKHLARETNKSVAEVEGMWEAAKEQADKKFKERDDHYWAYVVAVTKRKAGVKDDSGNQEK
jgi:hypothetical protein